MIDKELIEKSVRNILVALGDNPNREGNLVSVLRQIITI